MGWAGGKVWRKFPLNWEEFYPQKVLMKLCFHLVEIFLVHEIAFPPAGQIPPNLRGNFLLTWSHEIGPRAMDSILFACGELYPCSGLSELVFFV